MTKLLKVVIVILIIYTIVKYHSNQKEMFWMPGKPETPFGTPLSVPYRYTTSGLSYRMRDEHQLGLPTRSDFIASYGFPLSSDTGVPKKSIYAQHSLTNSGVGVDTTKKMSGWYVNPGILGPEKWSFYNLKF